MPTPITWPTSTPDLTATPGPTATHGFDAALAQALDIPGYPVETLGNARWTVDFSAFHTGASSARSGAIGNLQESSIELSGNGPGEVSFWWKVSSEANYDYLNFYLNGERKDRISGEVGWTQKNFDLPTGTNALKWVYVKDEYSIGGADAGWVDGMEFISNRECWIME